MSPDYRSVFFSEARLVSESMEHRRSQGERRRSVSCDKDDCYRVRSKFEISNHFKLVEQVSAQSEKMTYVQTKTIRENDIRTD